MILSGKLNSYLVDLNEQAQARLDLIVRQMAAAEGIDEKLKTADQMEWIRRMNSITKSGRGDASRIGLHVTRLKKACKD